MSLIADALRKTETPAGPSPSKQPPQQRSLWKFRLLLLALTGGVWIGLSVLTQQNTLPPTGQEPPSSAGMRPSAFYSTGTQRTPLIASLLPARGAELRGILYGEDGDSLAIIGNKIVAKGDLFGEARVTRISPTEVELTKGENSTTLRLSN